MVVCPARIAVQFIHQGGTILKQIVQTEKAPAAIGPYSQAVKANGLVFLSGQIALDPVTMDLAGNDVTEQTEQALRNLEQVLTAAGASLDQVVKTTVFLADMSDFAAMNEVYGKFFTQSKPARSTIQAAGLPMNVRVEIDAIALAE